ncbi:MAG: LemA family protein [Alphaproteobacteria bacterium]|nr:LemA family protein [Alphaproteobacteria bacterium]
MTVMSAALFLIILIPLYLVFLYNRFVRMQNQCEEGWSGISVQLKRRYDLIPNLVECVKGYAGYEQKTLEQIVEKRSAAINAATPVQKAAAENDLTQSLKSLFALSERYPDLKASNNFIELQNSLNTVEDDLQNARRYYNATVRNYNTAVDSFPSNLIARRFGFAKKEFFDIDDAAKENVKVTF